MVLAGPMGAGKSTVGRQIAERIRLPFVDLDAHIHAQTGRSPGQIFDEDGEAAFRVIEAAEADTLLTGESSIVLALGGGAFMTDSVRALCAAPTVLSVYLHADAAQSLSRIEAAPGPRRPLLDVADPMARLTALLEERDPVYRRAELMVPTADRTPEEIARDIVDRYREKLLR